MTKSNGGVIMETNNNYEEYNPQHLYKIIWVNWVDSASCANWVLDADMNAEPTYITSVGLCIKDEEHYIVIAQNYCNNPNQQSHIMAIPRGAIIEIKRLEVYEGKN